jgi:hypothetical protein
MAKTEKVKKGNDDGRRKTTELYIATKVQCPSCKRDWPKVDDAGIDVDVYCPSCAHYVEDWTKQEWFCGTCSTACAKVMGAWF